jgi:GR25 family glycosyltransferase involved in LPS biosynthesis
MDQLQWPCGPVQRFSAVDGQISIPPDWWRDGAGAWGCYQSHLGVLRQALEDGVESVCIFEDDAVFRPDFRQRVETFLKKVPADWESIYLGGQHWKRTEGSPVKVNEEVVKPYCLQRTHAYAFKGEGIKKVIAHYDKIMTEGRQSQGDQNRKVLHIDHWIAGIQKTNQITTYAPVQWLVGQGTARSDINGKSRRTPQYWGTAPMPPKGK